MYQYISKSKTQSKDNTPATNKSHVQTGIRIPTPTKSFFSPSLNRESDGETSSPNNISYSAQLIPSPYSPLQMKLMPKQERSEIQPLQLKMSETQDKLAPISAKTNNTGIPLQMKEKFESLSGFSFDDVRVHYNSDKPAQLQALAYTQGNQVYVASGQERHLGHELGHVVQQKQGRAQPTKQLGNYAINDDAKLELEADRMFIPIVQCKPARNVIQMMGEDFFTFDTVTTGKSQADITQENESKILKHIQDTKQERLYFGNLQYTVQKATESAITQSIKIISDDIDPSIQLFASNIKSHKNFSTDIEQAITKNLEAINPKQFITEDINFIINTLLANVVIPPTSADKVTNDLRKIYINSLASSKIFHQISNENAPLKETPAGKLFISRFVKEIQDSPFNGYLSGLVPRLENLQTNIVYSIDSAKTEIPNLFEALSLQSFLAEYELLPKYGTMLPKPLRGARSEPDFVVGRQKDSSDKIYSDPVSTPIPQGDKQVVAYWKSWFNDSYTNHSNGKGLGIACACILDLTLTPYADLIRLSGYFGKLIDEACSQTGVIQDPKTKSYTTTGKPKNKGERMGFCNTYVVAVELFVEPNRLNVINVIKDLFDNSRSISELFIETYTKESELPLDLF